MAIEADTAVLDGLRRSDYARLDANGQVYLDYTGAGLYADSQLSEHVELPRRSVFGNPHVVRRSGSEHTVAGLANGLGNVANAVAAGTPMVVTAGQQDRRHLIAEPLLSGDLAGLVSSRSLGELGIAIRRAFRLAAAPPTGPVFLGLPMDLLEEAG